MVWHCHNRYSKKKVIKYYIYYTMVEIKRSGLKGLVHPKLKIMSIITHPHVGVLF